MTVRRRAVIAILVGFPVGWLYIDIGWRLVAALLLSDRGNGPGSPACDGSGLAGLFGKYNGCEGFAYNLAFAVVELVVGTAVAVLVAWGLARFVTYPLRQMTDAMEQLGPTNLGLRLRQRGSRRDETRVLADSVDRMLDRVGEGYESQRRFAANASHELRTPLATQRALIEVSLSSALTSEQLELLSRQLLATNERNERLIEGLLVLAETERGLATRQALDLGEIAGIVAESLRPFAQERGIRLDVVATSLPVTGEHALLERLVANLVQNAIKYNVPDGVVTVSVSPDGLSVSNTGPPVPADQVAGLFEPFRRLGGERLDHGGGAGLGLTIARSIVAAHDGTVTARANPAGGLTVEVALP